MGLFDSNNQEQRTPAQRIADAVLASVRKQAEGIAREYDVNYARIWNTPGVDPKDVFAALGTDAGPMFYVTNTVLGLSYPERLKSIPAAYSYAINADGSITLTDVPQPSSSSSSSDNGVPPIPPFPSSSSSGGE